MNLNKRIRYANLKTFFNFVISTFDFKFHNPCDTPVLKKIFNVEGRSHESGIFVGGKPVEDFLLKQPGAFIYGFFCFDPFYPWRAWELLMISLIPYFVTAILNICLDFIAYIMRLRFFQRILTNTSI